MFIWEVARWYQIRIKIEMKHVLDNLIALTIFITIQLMLPFDTNNQCVYLIVAALHIVFCCSQVLCALEWGVSYLYIIKTYIRCHWTIRLVFIPKWIEENHYKSRSAIRRYWFWNFHRQSKVDFHISWYFGNTANEAAKIWYKFSDV